MSGKIGTFGAMMFKADTAAVPSAFFTSGTLKEKIRNKRMFSTGYVGIGSFVIPRARLFWDIGSKQTLVYVPSYGALDAPPLGSFPVSGIGAEVTAKIYLARIELSDTIAFDDLLVGVMVGNDAADDDSYEAADVIIGMDIIQNGVLTVDGPKREFTFEIK